MNPWEDAPPEILTLATFLNYFYRESDRGAALLAASMLDEIVLRILRAHFIEDAESEKLLTGFNAPLGTFSARLVAALCLGLIEKLEFNEANLIRKIRNHFAHGWVDISFDDNRIVGLVGGLRHEVPSLETTPRTIFNASVANLLGEWLWREGLVKTERRSPRTWPHKSGFLKEKL